MKKIRSLYTITAFFLLSNVSLHAQNLIINGGFDIADPPAWGGWTTTGSIVAHAVPWTDDVQFGFYSHTPDRFNSCEEGSVELRDGSMTNPLIEGNGCGFVGVYENEIFEQEIDGEKGKSYKFTFDIRLVADPYRINLSNEIGPHPTTPFGYSTSDGVKLNILVAKNKIKYLSNLNGDKDMSGGQDIEIVESADIFSIAYPLGEWHQVSAKLFSSVLDFEWIGFELIGPGYILIDNIALEKIDDCEECEEASCGPYDGCIDVTIGGSHGNETPGTGNFIHWAIFGLDEVQRMRIKLSNSPGQSFRTIDVIFPGSVWKFDGLDPMGGELPAGNIFFEVTLWNECEVRIEDDYFIKYNDIGIPTPDPSFWVSDPPNYVPPEPCCEDIIYINNDDLPNGGILRIDADLVVKALHAIIVGPGVLIEDGVDVELNAPHDGYIFFGADVELKGSANVINIYTDDCEEFTGDEPVDARNSGQEPAPSRTLNRKDIHITPNPNNGSFTIEIPITLIGSSILVIRNAGGIIVRTEKINPGTSTLNLSGLGKGVYFVQVRNEQRGFQQKVVVF